MKLREYASREDELISASVQGLCSGRHVQPEAVAAAVGMSRSKIYSRLRGETQWTAAEVAAVSRYFQVRRDDLYDGLGGRVGPQGGDSEPSGASSSMAELRTFNPKSARSRAFGPDFTTDATILVFPLDRARLAS